MTRPPLLTGVLPWHVGLDLHGVGLVAGVWLGGAALVAAWWYAAGLRRVLRHPRARRQRWRAAALAAGIASLVVVAAPPLGEVLEERLSTHMAQHLVLIMVSAPLLALAAPGQVLLAGMPATVRAPLVRWLRRIPTLGVATPHVAWALQIAALWLWHLPAAYDLAVRSDLAHLLEHATFLVTAWLFWWHLVRAGRLRGAAAAFYVIAAVPPGAALGAVLTFPDRPIYPDQAARAVAAGADPLLDQRIGGLVMWIPLDFVYLALGIWIFGRWLRRMGGTAPDGPVLPVDARPDPAEVVR